MSWLESLGDWWTRHRDPWGGSRYRRGPDGDGLFAEQTGAPAEPFTRTGAEWELRVMPLARFTVRARILSRCHYQDDSAAPIAPLDLFVCWGNEWQRGEMHDFELDHRERRCLLKRRWNGQFPVESLLKWCANIHILPATDLLKQPLLAVRPREIVELEGWLVDVRGRVGRHDDFRWRSSLSREDTGEGSCEVLWLERLHARHREWTLG